MFLFLNFWKTTKPLLQLQPPMEAQYINKVNSSDGRSDGQKAPTTGVGDIQRPLPLLEVWESKKDWIGPEPQGREWPLVTPSRTFGRKTFIGSRSSEKRKGRAGTKPKLVTKKEAATSNTINSPGAHSPVSPRGRWAVTPLGLRLCPRSGQQITAGSRPVLPLH